MAHESNQTMNDGSGAGLLDTTDYADFLQYVNSFNWSGAAEVDGFEDPFTTLLGGMMGSSATGLDPATFWLNLTSFPTTYNISPTLTNTSDSIETTATSPSGWIWEAGKLRIPLYRLVVYYFNSVYHTN